MKIVEVTNKTLAQEFIEVNVLINKANSNYIRPLDNEINEIFDIEKNRNFKYGKAIRWILKNDTNELIGRIAAFTNSKYINYGTNFTVGGCGFFDCINEQDAANLLFDTAKNWLIEQGMEAMDGPINFGDRDKWWGLLVDGFNREPIYGMPFNPEFYQQLFENYGFQNYYNQFWYNRNPKDSLSEKMAERHARFEKKPDYSCKHFKKSELEKFANDFVTVYNGAWAQHGEAKEITHSQVVNILKKMKPIMDEKLIWFAYYKNEPIAMWINMPDLNQYFKHFKGKFGWLQKLQLLWLQKMNKTTKFMGHSFGVIPKYQALGIDSYLIFEGSKQFRTSTTYEEVELGWAGDWNPRMVNIYKGIGGKQSRRLVTYRYIFNDKYPFERHPEMNYKS